MTEKSMKMCDLCLRNNIHLACAAALLQSRNMLPKVVGIPSAGQFTVNTYIFTVT